MKFQDKKWYVLLHLSMNMWGDNKAPFNFDTDTYHDILKQMVQRGYKHLILDVGDCLRYKKHTDIAIDGAWSYERAAEETAYAKALGIDIIPKLNFSATHDVWLGQYSRMLCTDKYYEVVRDTIQEVYDAFLQPEYIHIGMDEEDTRMGAVLDLMTVRQNELLWHDIRYMLECVKNTGAKPMMWADSMLYHPEEFKAHFKPEDVILLPWQYVSLYEEHYTPITNCERDYKYYTTGIFANSGMTYVEEDPMVVNYKEQTIPATKEGYTLIPSVSDYDNSRYNMPDTLRFFEENADMDNIDGFLVAPWVETTREKYGEIIRNLDKMDNCRRSDIGK